MLTRASDAGAFLQPFETKGLAANHAHLPKHHISLAQFWVCSRLMFLHALH
jgi:hypothetical protein